MVLAGYQVLTGVEGTASLPGTVLVEGVRAVVQAAPHGCSPLLTASTPEEGVSNSLACTSRWKASSTYRSTGSWWAELALVRSHRGVPVRGNQLLVPLGVVVVICASGHSLGALLVKVQQAWAR